MKHVLCVDIGGTRTRVALVGPEGTLDHISAPTPRGDSAQILRQCIELIEKIGTQKVSALSIGCAGPVNGSKMEGSKPMELTETIDFEKSVGAVFEIPLFVANDLQMAVHAEKSQGKGRGFSNFALVSLSTGTGVGAVLGGKVVASRIELGHSVVETNESRAHICEPLGHAGCWVSQASGSSIEAHLRRQGISKTLADFFSDPDQTYLQDLRRYNARGLTHVIHAFDPEKIIIMGSLGVQQFTHVIPSASELENYSLLRPIPTIEPTILGDEIGLLGAYEFARERLCNQ